MNNFSVINERILYLIDNKANGNQKKFAESIGFAPQVISNIISGRKSKPSFDVLAAVLSTYVDVSAEWLILGSGSILKTDKHPTATEATGSLVDRLVTENTNLATQLGMQIKENEQLHKQNMELLAENERLTNKAKKITTRPADTMDHHPIAAESKPEYK